MEDVVLELTNITKTFPGVKALDNVNFLLKKGQIHAIMGENGAGKSTFIKIITGVHMPNEGTIFLNGEKVSFKNPRDAQKHSISAIYQHSTSYPNLSITENIFIGHEDVSKYTKTINWKSLHEKSKKLLESLSSNLDPRTLVGQLTVAEQQVVEIAKAISTNAKIIIMDEPTASLSNRECENLYNITEKLRDSGVSIIFISHRFEDMYRLASVVTVLRDGKYIGTYDVNEISNRELIKHMVGRDIEQIYPKREKNIKEEFLIVKNLTKKGIFKDISFSLKKGEILGFSGLVGAGRTDVMECIFGVSKADSGDVYLDGKKLSLDSPKQSFKDGIGLLPEDRQKQGLVLDFEIYKNVTLSNLEAFTKKTILIQNEEREKAKQLGEKVALKAPTVYDKAFTLSGGNQQKVVFCKLLNSDLKVLILDEPTKGVDVGAKSQIYEIMNQLVNSGYGIILISSDMPEILGMSDRIIAMHEGKIVKEFTENVSQEKLLNAVMNQKEEV